MAPGGFPGTEVEVMGSVDGEVMGLVEIGVGFFVETGVGVLVDTGVGVLVKAGVGFFEQSLHSLLYLSGVLGWHSTLHLEHLTRMSRLP